MRATEIRQPDNEFGKPIEQWSLEEMEKVHVRRVLQSTHWHRGQACEVLGVSRPRLRRMIRQFEISTIICGGGTRAVQNRCTEPPVLVYQAAGKYSSILNGPRVRMRQALQGTKK